MSVYIPRKPPSTTIASCYPEKPMLTCRICMRLREGNPPHIDVRQFVVIDASLFVRDGACPMFEGRPAAVPHSEPAERESEFA
jgi:hypothetical protein